MSVYHQPTTLEAALALLHADPALLVVAGATDVYPAKTTRAGWGHTTHPGVLDISRVAGLAGIHEETDGWRIGAGTTWSAIADHTLPPLFDGLKAAARDIGGRQIQNRGTIAGNICTASPAGDGIPCLLALDAEIIAASSRGERRLPVSDFVDGYRHTQRARDEIITSIFVPRRSGRSTFLKLGARRYLVISIAMVAARIATDADGRITEAAIAVGACAPVAQRLPALEREAIGCLPDAVDVEQRHLAGLAPLDDVRASAEYRRAAALTLVRDIFAQFAKTSREAA